MHTKDCPNACGCCTGVESLVPKAVSNRPGLSEIAYRVGTHPEFMASLLASLSSSRAPALQGLRTRSSEDFTIALCDALAVMADTLTFYQERIANEVYLRTATEPRSVHELAALIGYRPAPGVAANSYLAFKLEEAPGAPDQAPTAVTIPAGTRVQSVPASGETPQSFETMSEIEGKPEWNALRPRLTEPYLPKVDLKDLYFDGVDHNLKPGDLILLVGDERHRDPSSVLWETRVLKTVKTGGGVTHVTWLEGLTTPPLEHPHAYVFRQRAAIFGHSAPDWSGQPDTYKASYMGLEVPDQLTRDERIEWPLYQIFAPDPTRDKNTFGRFVNPTAEEVANTMSEALKAAMLAQGRDVISTLMGAAGAGGQSIQHTFQDIVASASGLMAALKIGPDMIKEVWDNTLKDIFSGLSGMGAAVGGVGQAVGGAATAVGKLGTDLVGELKKIHL